MTMINSETGSIVRVLDPGYQSHHIYVWLGKDGNWFAQMEKARTDLTMADYLALDPVLQTWSHFQPAGPYRP